jgi:uncharacterized protein (DUF885 family)
MNPSFPRESEISRSPEDRLNRSGLLALLAGWLLLQVLPIPVAHAQESTTPPPTPESQVLSSLQDIYDEFWRYQLEVSPMLAAEYGDQSAMGKLPESGIKTINRDLQKYFEFFNAMYALDLSLISVKDRQQAEILINIIENRLDGIRVGEHLTPINQRRGPQVWLPRLHSQMRFSQMENYRHYLSRLEQVPAYVAGVQEILERAVSEGFLPPRVTLMGVLDQFKACTSPAPADSLFYQPFQEMPPGTNPEEWNQILQKAQSVIGEKVQPALVDLATYLESTYIPLSRDSYGAYEFPNGNEFYSFCIRKHTSTHLTALDIHQLGLKEVARIRSEMQKIIEEVEFDGDFAAFVNFLREDSRFYHQSEDDLLQGYRDICKRADAMMPALFGKLPRTPYGVRAIPSHEAPRSTTAYYMPPPADGTQPGWFYANTFDLQSRPIYEMEALALHEAVPGHHHQLALQGEMEGLPDWRKITHFTAYIEGWGLYAESLGDQMGFYQDPYSRFGKLSYEMWRALRLVVDTGIHQLGWTRDQAIQVMLENSALTRKNVEAEVDRYIAWPGQALAYKVGELEIKALVKKAKETLGTRFDIRGFHDHLLAEGSMPLEILRMRMESWIESQKGSGEPASPAQD